MKLALCHYSLRRLWRSQNWTPDRLAEEVRTLGVDAIDFHAKFFSSPAAAVEPLRQALRKHDLTLSGFSLKNDFALESDEARREQVRLVEQWILVAAELRAPVARIFGGHLSREDRLDPSKTANAVRRTVECLEQVVPFAAKNGVILALENHGGLPGTGEEQIEMIRKISSSHLKATVDVGNYMICGEESVHGTRIASPYAAYVHVKDFRKLPDSSSSSGWRFEPCAVGDGDVDHATCLRILRDAGYDGFVALEYEGAEDETTAIPRSIQVIKRLLETCG